MAFEIEIMPLSQRAATIAARWEQSTQYGETIYDFRGGELKPKVISVPISLPVYRMENCRTFSAQQSEIAVHGYDKDFFSKGQEKSSVQQVQHLILSKLSKNKTGSVTPILDVLKKDGQREEILITHTGVVVNGNRRLSAMRELYRNSDGSVDERFSHVRCAVLPMDITPDEIDDIEADLQARPQTKLDYDWIGDARLVRRQVSKEDRTIKEVADRLRRSKADIENTLQALDEADLYLSEWAQKPGQYDLVSGEGEQIFGDIPKKIAKKDVDLQNASRVIAWSLFQNRDRLPGRVYAFNAAFGRLAPQVLDTLFEELELEADDSDDDFDGDFDIDIEADDSTKNYQPIIDALRNDETGDAVSVLIDACESAIEREKGLKSEKAALKALSQANAKVSGVDVSMAGESTLPAMLKQIDTIRDVLNKIESKVKQRLAENDTDQPN